MYCSRGGIRLEILETLFLGLVQGLTEFLPVSSSGHLVIFQNILGINEGEITLDILLHLGTLVAVFACFWEDIWELVRHPFQRFTGLLLLGCIPAGIVGVLFESFFEQAFQSLLVVGLGLLFTGFILWFSERISWNFFNYKDQNSMTFKDAIFIGLLQAIAIIPGISRSGSTISAALAMGLDRSLAARYSFLLSIPTILGAAGFKLRDIFRTGISSHLILPYVLGTLCAAICGYIAIKLVLDLVKRGNLSVFSYYCWSIGGLVLVYKAITFIL